jgi:hypothetical protein
MLAAFVQVGRVSIVVIRLKALRADMVVRCGELNIGYAVWRSGLTLTGIWRAIVGGRIVEWTSRGGIGVSSRVGWQEQQR